jgi:hypothetical protein
LARGLAAARTALLSQPRLVLGSVLLHLVGKLWIVAEMALLLVLLGLSPALAPWLGAASVVASVLGAAIPGQMGAVEAAVFAACTTLGVAEPCSLTERAAPISPRSLPPPARGRLLALPRRQDPRRPPCEFGRS